MQDVDVIDRNHTKTSPAQAVLAVLALLPIIAIALQLNPALGYWGRGQFRAAIIVAILCPGVYAAVLGLAYPIASALRGEMSRRGLLTALVVFGALAVVLHILAYVSLPGWLALHPSRPGHTGWLNYIQHISFFATITGYATGFATGSLLALVFRRSPIPSMITRA